MGRTECVGCARLAHQDWPEGRRAELSRRAMRTQPVRLRLTGGRRAARRADWQAALLWAAAVCTGGSYCTAERSLCAHSLAQTCGLLSRQTQWRESSLKTSAKAEGDRQTHYCTTIEYLQAAQFAHSSS